MIGIKEIKVDKLFGKYDYRLKAQGQNQLLYGDNGSGKSTILKLVFHLLGTSNSAGHKTWLANCPFKKLVVVTTSGYSISANRKDTIVGSYSIAISGPDMNFSVVLNAFQEGGSYIVAGGATIDSEYLKLSFLIGKFAPRIVFVTDERSISDSKNQGSASENDYTKFIPAYEHGSERLSYRNRDENPSLDVRVSNSLIAVGQYINNVVSLATIEGDSNVNQIYLKLFKNISKAGGRNSSENLEEKVSYVSNIIPEYIKFGLMPNLELEQYMVLYRKANQNSKLAFEKILLPLLDSLDERMNALEPAKSLIGAFYNTINEVLLDKELHYLYGRGVTILSDGVPIASGTLSSGEKQLVILMCNLICLAEYSPVFFIDEPEISLNIKWQRKFVSMLEKITKHSECQFFLATHSMEILGQYTDLVTNLNEQRNARVH